MSLSLLASALSRFTTSGTTFSSGIIGIGGLLANKIMLEEH
jgi:hypothetical protein